MVFIDEIQNVPEFEKLLEGLFVTPRRLYRGAKVTQCEKKC